MERRDEGVERERYVPERGREVTRESVERERIVEPRRQVARPSEPTSTYDEGYGQLEPGIVLRARDLTRWGAVIGGFFAALSIVVLLGVLGAAIGLQVAGGTAAAPAGTGIGAAIWGGITLIVSFFVGGWLAGRTAAIAGPLVGLIHGFTVWALTVSALVLAAAFGLGALGSMFVGATAPGVSATQMAGWGAFIALLLGLVAALFGGWVGGQSVPRPQAPAR